jgi:adenylate cyclase
MSGKASTELPRGVPVTIKKRVLVVDDDPSSQFVLSRTLEALGHRVAVAEDGAVVPELIAQHPFDLLVVDLYMPGMNGFELLRRIRAPDPGFLPVPRTPPSVRVLVVSGEGNAASIANARRLGADGYLVKPVDVDEFEEMIRTLLPG